MERSKKKSMKRCVNMKKYKVALNVEVKDGENNDRD